MFETSIYCDKCGSGYSFSDIEPKYFMIKTAREKGWTVGKKHLCPNCRRQNGRAGEKNA